MKLGFLVKAAPLALAAVALWHGAFPAGLASDGGVGLTNVAGQTGDCAAPVRNAACATLFDGSDILFPGGPAAQRTVTVTWHGGGRPASFLGLFVGNFSSRSASSRPGCTAPDPASRLDLSISQDSRPLYLGTLSAFARDHGSAPSALPAAGDSGRFTIAVALDANADNSYMGCVSSADLVWTASQ